MYKTKRITVCKHIISDRICLRHCIYLIIHIFLKALQLFNNSHIYNTCISF